MQADRSVPATVDEYIAGFPADVQALLRQLRATVHAAEPAVEEAIKYGMPTFMLHGNLVYFAAFKKHIGFFAAPAADAELKAALAPYAGPKGSLTFPYGTPIPFDLITRAVVLRARENRERAASGAKPK